MNLLNDDQAGYFEEVSGGLPVRARRRWASFGAAAVLGELIWLADFFCLIVIAPASVVAYSWLPRQEGLEVSFSAAVGPLGLAVALLAPFMFHDGEFGANASRGRFGTIARSHALRFIAFVSGVLLLGLTSNFWNGFSVDTMLIWFAAAFVSTSTLRLALERVLLSLQRQGLLTEVVAVVGAGPVADRLVRQLRISRPNSIDMLGIFDDNTAAMTSDSALPVGSISQLLELGKTRRIDWIVLTMPSSARHMVTDAVQRLKALAVPIALCPQSIGLALQPRAIAYVGDNMAVSLLSKLPASRRDVWIKAGEDLLPRWIVTLAMLPAAAFMAYSAAPPTLPVPVTPVRRRRTAERLKLQFDNHDLTSFTRLAANFGSDRFAYVVTPNVDHVIRLNEDAKFRALYAGADFTLLDSRFLSHVMKFSKGIDLPVCTGSDLTEKLFSEVISADDAVVLIGATDRQAEILTERFGLRNLAHFNPPMGFIHKPAEVQACLDFVESHSPFRFCLLAVGSPQQEVLAQMLKSRATARGLTLCIGASINFLTGTEKRAPQWLQRAGMEWSYRLMQAPRRLAGRYLVRGPRVFGLLRHADVQLKGKPAAGYHLG
jgi:exopolysaccharide biosynthesis WecB/TagA/CpsF family protein